MSELQQKIMAAAGLLTGAVGTAHAALPAEATAAFGTISANATDVLALVWPITVIFTGGFILLRMFKKGANKAV